MLVLSVATIALMGVSACGDDDPSNNGAANNGAGDTGDVTLDAGDTGTDVEDGGSDATDATDTDDGGGDATDGGDTTDGGDATDGGDGGDATDGGEDATDLCADVTCEAPAPSCDGDTVVSYTGAGTCDSADGTCDFSGVEERTDCATDQACSLGQCIDPTDNSVGAGDLVITEFMNDPSAVSDGDGEYFEVYNTTARTLHLNGLTVEEDDGGNSITLTDPNSDPIAVAPNTYFVLGKNADTATNGGVPVDHQYDSTFTLGNGSDEIVILDGTTEIDRVEYDGGTDWTDPSGASLQFGAEYNMVSDDNNVGANWCLSRDLIDDTAAESDYGTPGAANVDCTLPTAVISIYDLQDPSSANHPLIGQPVDIDGVVVTAVNGDDVWVQDPTGGERSGVYVDMSGVTTAVAVGDNVDIEGTYEEGAWPNLDVTTVVATTVAASSNGATITPDVIDASVLADDNTAEAWEGVLIELAEPAVTNENPDADGSGTDHAEFSVDGAFRVDDELFDYNTNVADPTNCDTFSSLTGVVHWSYGNYKMLPREAGDIPAPAALSSSGATANVAIAASTFTPADTCVDNGATVTWTNGDTVDHTATERNPVTDAAATSPAFDLSLSATGGSANQTFADAGTYHYLCTIHPTMTGRVIVLE
jgi:plastocyanin